MNYDIGDTNGGRPRFLAAYGTDGPANDCRRRRTPVSAVIRAASEHPTDSFGPISRVLKPWRPSATAQCEALAEDRDEVTEMDDFIGATRQVCLHLQT
jgi:hypothetical protein